MDGNNTSESSYGGGHRRELRVRLSGGGAKPIRIIKVYGPTEEREKNMTPEELGRIRRGLQSSTMSSPAHTQKGPLALWLGPETIAHFRNLTVKLASSENKD